MSEIEIAGRIRAGKDFRVTNDKDRRKVLVAAKFLEANLTTRAAAIGFNIIFIK